MKGAAYLQSTMVAPFERFELEKIRQKAESTRVADIPAIRRI
jgi:hypothetical protein